MKAPIGNRLGATTDHRKMVEEHMGGTMVLD
jgi:hypothetical protein